MSSVVLEGIRTYDMRVTHINQELVPVGGGKPRARRRVDCVLEFGSPYEKRIIRTIKEMELEWRRKAPTGAPWRSTLVNLSAVWARPMLALRATATSGDSPSPTLQIKGQETTQAKFHEAAKGHGAVCDVGFKLVPYGGDGEPYGVRAGLIYVNYLGEHANLLRLVDKKVDMPEAA